MSPRNYPPGLGLRALVRRHYVFEADLPEGYVLEDTLLSEFAFIRILIRGEWTAETSPGNWTSAGQAVFFGANSRPLKVRCKGSFKVAGLALRPSGWRSLFSTPAGDLADQMLPLADVMGPCANTMLERVLAAKDDAEIVAAMEAVLLDAHERRGRPPADSTMRIFEDIARSDSTMAVQDVADRLGLSLRQLERRCLTAFGHRPKTVLRRSRFLDMATALRGFSDPDQETLAALRYFDQSHKSREFRHFIGLTPGKFDKQATPLLTAGLKLRAEGVA